MREFSTFAGEDRSGMQARGRICIVKETETSLQKGSSAGLFIEGETTPEALGGGDKQKATACELIITKRAEGISTHVLLWVSPVDSGRAKEGIRADLKIRGSSFAGLEGSMPFYRGEDVGKSLGA